MASRSAKDYRKNKTGNTLSSRSAKYYRTNEEDLTDFYDSFQAIVDNWSKARDDYFKETENYYTNRDLSVYGLDNSKGWKDTVSSKHTWLENEALRINSILDEYGDYFDSDTKSMLKSTFADSLTTSSKFVKQADTDINFWNEFKDEGEYQNYYFSNKYNGKSYTDVLKAIETADGNEKDWLTNNSQYFMSSKEAQAEIDKLSEYKSGYSAIETELSNLVNQLTNAYRRAGYGSKVEQMVESNSRVAKLREQLKGYDKNGTENRIAELTEIKGQATLKENNKVLEDEAKSDKEFGSYVALGESKGMEKEWDFYVSAAGGIPMPERTYSDKIVASRNGEYVSDGDAKDLARQMTDEQYNNYLYFLGKYGKKKAQEYLDTIEYELNTKSALEIQKSLEGTVILPQLFGFYAGVDSYWDNLEGIFSDGYKAPSSTQIASGLVREDQGWFGKVTYDLANTTGHMMPSILGSMAATSLLGPAGLGVAGATTAGSIGQGVGAGLVGLSAMGGAKQEMLNLGYSNAQATTYGILTGASEACLQYALGGIGKLGGAWTDDAVKALTKGINSAGAKFAIEFGADMASEALEESLQEVLNPFFKKVATGKNEGVDWAQVGYNGLLGALSAGLLNGLGSAGTRVGEVSLAKQIKKDGNIGKLKEIGNTFSADTLAYKLASKVDENTGAWKLADLIHEMHGTLSEQNVADIKYELVRNGMVESDAESIAGWLAKAVDGDNFTATQRKALDNNPIISRVFKKVIIDKNSTVNQRLQALMDLEGTEGHAGVDYSAIYKSQSKEGLTASANFHQALKSAQTDAIKQRFGIGRTALGDTDATIDSMVAETKKAMSKGKVSESGVTTDSITGKQISIKKVKSNDGKQMTYELANGSVIDSKNVEYANDDEGILHEHMLEMGYDADIANAIINGRSAVSDMPIMTYLNGIDEAIEYGKIGYPMEKISSNGFYAELPNSMKTYAYNLGKDSSKKATATAQAKVDSVKGKVDTAKEGKVIIPSKATLTERQRTSIETLGKVVSDVTHNKVVFFNTEKKGNAIVFAEDVAGHKKGAKAPNGFYDRATGTIYIDLNAGQNGEGVILWTAAHELTHFIRQWSPAKFKVLAGFLMEEYGKRGVDIESLIDNKIAEAKAQKKNLTRDKAYEEVVADSMQMMFTDTNLAYKLDKLKNKDKSLWGKIKEFFRDLYARITKEYKGLDPQTEEAKLVHSMGKTIEKISDLFAEAIVDAGNTFANAEQQTLSEAGIGFDAETQSVYSLRYSTGRKDALGNVIDVVTVGKKNFNTEAIAQLVAKGTGRSIEDARKWVNSEIAIANIVMNHPEFLDFQADDRYEAIKKNSDYPQGTVDLSNLCPKRTEFTAMFDMLQKKYPNKLFTANDVASMRNILKERGITVACGACFVEDRRQLLGEIADTYIGMWKEAVETGKPLQKTNASGNKVTLTVTAALAKQYGLTKGSEILATDKYIPTQYDLTTYEGFKLLEKNHPTIAMGFNRYNNSRGQQAGRLIEGRAEYNRQILGWSDAKIKSVNNNGGLRIFSFSDFEVVHLLDLVQVILDCSAKGVKIQGYTKIPSFARLIRDTGIKINRSLIPKGQTGLKMVDGKQVLDYDTTEGIDINDENFIDERDTPNVGNILIGINPTQIGIAMLDDFVDYIIPFHTNKSKDICKALGLAEWVNYKESQHEKDIDTGKASKHNVNIYTEVMGKYHPTNKVEFVNAFLKVCKAQKKIPRYSEFLNKEYKADGAYTDEYGSFDFTYREGYHKLLVDFKMFDRNGNILPQGEITPNLDEAFMAELLKGEVDKKQNYEFPQEVYEQLDKEFGETEASAEDSFDYSERSPYDGKKLYENGEVYDYSLMVSLDNMEVKSLPSLASVKDNGKISQSKVVSLGLENAKSIGREITQTQYAIKNAYTKRDIILGTNGLNHGLDASNISRLRTNARLSAIGGYIVQNAIPVNGLKKENKQANGTYAMACLLKDGDGYVVAIVTVDEFSSQAIDFDFVEITHSINGRFIANKKDSRSSTRELELGQESLSTTTVSTISIADFLEIVNSTHRSILSDDVLKHFDESRPEGHYTDRVLFSDRTAPKAIEHFGTTSNFEQAGFVVADGRMLNLSKYGLNGVNHSRIAEVYDDAKGSDAVNRFIQEGNVRIKATSPGIEIGETAITTSQLNAISRFIGNSLRSKGYFYLDITGKDGESIASVEYDEDSSAEDIIYDIKAYYERGRVPSQKSWYSYSERVTDKKTLDFLNEQIERGEYITVYRSFQVRDGGLYAPMNSVDRDENGKNKRLGYRSEIGKWEMATESRAIAQKYMDAHPDAPYAKFDLDAVDNKTNGVAYNPYLHASNLVLNDQFSAAYRRNLVTVECRVPLSEANGAYRADYAKDGTGWAEWKAGRVAGELKKAKPGFDRKLFLSRYMLPVRIIPDSEVAQMYKEYLDGTDVSVPWNVVTPSLRHELEKLGVSISYDDVNMSSGKLKFSEMFPNEAPDFQYSERILMGSLFSGGGTLEAGLAYQMLDKQFGVEYDGKIASVYADNHGDHVYVGRVEDFDISKHDDIFYLHASPVCHNFSKAKHGAKELQMDIDSAKATAKHLETAMPQVFTVENAPGYRKSQSLKIITDKLTELGYKWDVDVYNSADYGSATSRNRVILRAVKDGELPAKPTKQERTNSWDKVTRDLWDTLPKSTLRQSFISAIENTTSLPILDANGKVNVNKPLLILTTTSGHTVTYCWEGEICPTLTTKCGEAKLVMPDGNIYAVTPEFMGRIQGLPTDYKYPKEKTRAFTIIGNGIPTHLTKAVVGGVLDSAYEQTHDGEMLYSERTSNATDNRTLLANALETVAKNDVERSWLAKYKSQIESLNADQNELSKIRAKIREVRFTQGADRSQLSALENKAKILADRINRADKKLLNLEASKPLQGVIERERAKAYQLGKQKLTEYREQRAISSALNYYRPRMEKIVGDLQNRLEHPSAKTAIPEAFGASIAKVLSAFNFTTYDKDGKPRPSKANVTREEARESLRTLAKQLEQNSIESQYGQLDIPPEMLEWIESVAAYFDSAVYRVGQAGELAINKMDAEQLKTTYKFLRSLQTAINKAGKYYTNASYDVASDARSTIDYVGKLPKEVHEKVEKALKVFKWDFASPVTVFDRFGEGGQHVYNMLVKGQSKMAYNSQAIIDFVDNAYTEKEAKEWRETLTTVTIGGKEYNVPVEMLMGLHCLLKQEDSRRHILDGGGIRFGDVEHKGKVTRFENVFFNEIDAMAVEKALDAFPRAREVADKMQKFMQEQGSSWGNEISMVRYGYHAFTNDLYYPIRTVAAGSEYEAQQKRANIYALLNKSFTKERTPGANNAVIVDGIFSVFNNHMSEMALYNAWALPVIDTIKWFNYKETQDIDAKVSEKSVHETFRLAYGNYADEYVRRLLESINSQTDNGLSEEWAFLNLRKVNRVAVSWNIRVAIQQPFSVTRAMELINPKYITPLVGKAYTEAREEMLANSGIAKWKSLGYYDADISKPMEARVLKNETFIDKTSDVGMKGAEIGDSLTWTALWNACKKETAEKNPRLEGKALLEKTTARFDDIVLRTQVVDSVLTKPQWLRSKGFWHKSTSAFMSEPLTSYNALLRQADKFTRDQAIHGNKYAVRNNAKNIVRATGVFLLTQLVNALATAPIDGLRDDDDYETYLEKVLASFKENALMNLLPTSLLPYVSDIVEYYMYGRTDRPDMSLWVGAIDLGKQTWNLFDPDKYSYHKLHKTFNSMLKVGSQLSGFSVSNMFRDVLSVYNAVAGALGYGELKFQTAEDSHSEGYKRMYEAMLDGNEDRMGYLLGQLLSNGVDEDKVYNGLTKLVGEDVKSGEITDEEAAKRLREIINYLGKTDSDGNPITDIDIYWMIDKWKYAGENGNTENYEKYDDIFTAMEEGDPSSAIEEHVERLTEHYYEVAKAKADRNGTTFNERKAEKEAESKAESAVKSGITAYWKPLYQDAYKADNEDEMDRIIDMLYDTGLYGSRSDVKKTVKGWLKS